MKIKKTLSGLISLLIVLSVIYISYPAGASSFDESDMEVLKNIYNQNKNAELLDWDFNNPLTMDGVEWSNDNGSYQLHALDISGMDITGIIDLSSCNNLEQYNFSNTLINLIVLPAESQTVPEGSFENCSDLISVIISSQDTLIESYAFSGCVSLKCVSNAENIKSIGRNAFNNCSNVIFYCDEISNSYVNDYADLYGFGYSNSEKIDVYGYAAVMQDGKQQRVNLSEINIPYRVGTAYLYNNSGVLIDKITTDLNGRFDFCDLNIGYSYRVVIDGSSAYPRTIDFIVDSAEFSISEHENAFTMAMCDFMKDGYINVNDYSLLASHSGIRITKDNPEDWIYDLNCDNIVDSKDNQIFNLFLAYSSLESIYK